MHDINWTIGTSESILRGKGDKSDKREGGAARNNCIAFHTGAWEFFSVEIHPSPNNSLLHHIWLKQTSPNIKQWLIMKNRKQ